jgi:hypothetical protein
VYQFLYKHSNKNIGAAKATEAYNSTDPKEAIPGPFGPLPAEMDRSADIQLPPDVKLDTQKLPSPIGELARMQVLVESLRLKQENEAIDPTLIKPDQIKDILDALNNAAV